MPIYLKYDGVDGEVSAHGHEKWIEVHSFQWGVGRGISSPTGGSADRESSAPSISEIVITKPTDSASVHLLDEALQGEGKLVKIDFVKTDKGKLETYLSYELTNTMISGFSMSSGGDKPQESISLNFTKVMFNEKGSDIAGKVGQPSKVTYDISLAKIV